MDTLVRLAKILLYSSGAYKARRLQGRLSHPGPRVVILVYHNIIPDVPDRTERHQHYQIRPDVTAAMFAAHMEMLKSVCPIRPLVSVLSELREGTLQDDTAVITFDDGYRSFLENAFPVLERLSIPATVFLATDYVERERFFWWDELNQVVYRLWKTGANIGDAKVLSGVNNNVSTIPAGIEGANSFLGHVESSLRYADAPRQREVVDTLRRLLPDTEQEKLKPEPILTWNEIRHLSERGIHFGSHTCSHFSFAHVTRDQVARELEQSKAEIERQVEQEVNCLAYPYGQDLAAYRPAHDLLSSSGYRYARTTSPGFNDAEADPLMLKSGSIGAHESGVLIRRDIALGFVR